VCVCGVCVVCVREFGFFYISNLFAECQMRSTRQRKYFAECPRSGTRRNKKLKKIMSWLCRVPRVSTRQNIHFAECQTLALSKIIFFCFLPPTFFLRFVFVPWTTCSNLAQFHCCLLYFFTLFRLVAIFRKM
jgi:hypothetical protein